MSFTLHLSFRKTSLRLPEKAALSDQSGELTYQELRQCVDSLTFQLSDAGVKRGDRVAFLLPHSIEQAIAILAISALEAVFVPVNELLKPAQIQHQLSDSQAKALLSTASLLETVRIVFKPNCTTILVDRASRSTKEFPVRETGTENDLAGLLYTSGSTGKPKGVMVTHRNLSSGAEIVSEYLSLSENDRLLGILPLSFDYGLNQIITMLSLGGYYRFQKFSFPQEIVDALDKFKITGLAGIPTLWALLGRSRLAKTDLPMLRFLTNSGGAMPTSILGKLQTALPKVRIFLMYGLTEAFRSSYLDPDQLANRPSSMGKAIPNTELFVVDENGERCQPGQVGELVHRGPTVALGYWRREEATLEHFRQIECPNQATPVKETVVFSGDLVREDAEGYLYFVGRKDGMIKRSGFRISPSEIEEVFFQLDFIKEAAAVGIDDPQEGQIIKVFVVLCQSLSLSKSEAIEEAMAFSSKQLPRYMIPSSIESVDKMPKTAAGKINYPELKQRE